MTVFRIGFTALLFIFVSDARVAFSEEGGSRGIAFDKDSDRGIADVVLVFISEDMQVTKTVATGVGGSYRIDLSAGRYRVAALHKDYKPYFTGRGFFVIREGRYGTGNFFLKRTTDD